MGMIFCRDCISAFREKVQIQIFFSTQQAANKWLRFKYRIMTAVISLTYAIS